MQNDYLMNIATALYFICYVPEFYANYTNKNANMYNVFEKIVMLGGTGFGLGYACSIHNNALVVNYGPLFILDSIALFMRAYYAYKNRNTDVRVRHKEEFDLEMQPTQHNPIHTIEWEIPADKPEDVIEWEIPKHVIEWEPDL